LVRGFPDVARRAIRHIPRGHVAFGWVAVAFVAMFGLQTYLFA